MRLTKTIQKTHPFVAAMVSLLLLLAAAGPASADGWQPITPGIEYQLFRLPGPNRAYVARMDLGATDVTLETSLADRQLEDGTQTVRGMAELYDETLSAWTPNWGSRMHVAVAINGSFHDVETGVPLGGMVQGGWYIRRFDDLAGGSGFGWRRDRTAFIGGCVDQPADDQRLTVLRTGASHPVADINAGPRADNIAIYTQHYGRRMPDRTGFGIRVRMEEPMGIFPYPRMAYGVITQIQDNIANAAVPFDEIVLSARGSATDWLETQVRVGDRIGISTQIDHYEADCETRRSESWAETYASLSGSFEFLLDGDIRSFDALGATNRNPRTAICYNDEWLYFVVVDGRSPGFSVGMTIDELGRFCRDRLGADWGINQDGGGSSTMWIEGEVVNQPSDGHERAVSNGIMMVVLQPNETSDTFRVGDQVRARQLIDASMGPGDIFQTPWDIGEGESATVVADPHGLDGVLATGKSWWKVRVGDRTGWVPETALERIAPRPTPTPEPSATAAPDDPKTLFASQQWLRLRARLSLLAMAPPW
jgi:hypothetical protein